MVNYPAPGTDLFTSSQQDVLDLQDVLGRQDVFGWQDVFGQQDVLGRPSAPHISPFFII